MNLLDTEPRTGSTMTLGAAVDRFLAVSDLAENTKRGYRDALGKLVEVVGTDTPVADVDAEALTMYMDLRKVTGNLNAGSANALLRRLHRFMRWCQSNGYIAADPLVDQQAAPEPAVERVFLARKDWPRLLDAAGEHHPAVRMAVAINLFCATRAGEIPEIQLWHINREARIMLIPQPKTKIPKQVPICDELADELDRWMKFYRANASERFKDNAYLVPWFHNHRADIRPYMKNVHIGRRITKAYRAAGVQAKRVGGHDGRHSAAADLNGRTEGDIEMVQALLGHTSRVTTERYLNVQVATGRLHRFVTRNATGAGRDEGDVITTTPPHVRAEKRMIEHRIDRYHNRYMLALIAGVIGAAGAAVGFLVPGQDTPILPVVWPIMEAVGFLLVAVAVLVTAVTGIGHVRAAYQLRQYRDRMRSLRLYARRP